ncbi:hypothetical protein GW17_00036231 [Ensete ventricosum]|nr:hypothetical protein GW17_00036231 [Ensete ventricosum]
MREQKVEPKEHILLVSTGPLCSPPFLPHKFRAKKSEVSPIDRGEERFPRAPLGSRSIERGARAMQRQRAMSWRSVGKAAQGLAAHALLFCFTLFVALKIDGRMSYSWWSVLSSPLALPSSPSLILSSYRLPVSFSSGFWAGSLAIVRNYWKEDAGLRF